MGKRYSHSVIRMYTEVLLWVLLKNLSRAQEPSVQENNSYVPIHLDRNNPRNNIIQFNFQEGNIFLHRVSNKKLSNYLNESIDLINPENLNLISCNPKSYMFDEKINSSQKKAKFAENRMRQILGGRYQIGRDDIGCIFTELNNAGLVGKKNQEFFSSYINLALENLIDDSIQRYIQRICGAGGIYDEYLLRDNQQSTLNPRIREIMRVWTNSIFGCDIESWNENQWNRFEEQWGRTYQSTPYPPPRRYLRSILEITSTTVPNLEFCILLYNFLRIRKEEELNTLNRNEFSQSNNCYIYLRDTD